MNAKADRHTLLDSAGLALGVLTFINLLNYLDRFVVSALAETLKHSALALSDFKLGSLMTSFLLVYLFTAPVFGALGDRRSRPRLIAFGVGIWSLATALSGFAGSYVALLGARAAVGIGEAAYGTIAPALLGDYFPANQRGRVMAVFFCAIPVGAALGYIVGGLIDAHYGWRMAFFVAGAPGLALAGLMLTLRDPPRGAQDAGTSTPPPIKRGTRADLIATYARLLRNSPYVLTVLGYAAYTFAVGGLGFWMPAFLERARGIPRPQATVSFGEIVVVTGVVGTVAGLSMGIGRGNPHRGPLRLGCAHKRVASVLLDRHGGGAAVSVRFDRPHQCGNPESHLTAGACLGDRRQHIHHPHTRRCAVAARHWRAFRRSLA
jgi:MFS family permease